MKVSVIMTLHRLCTVLLDDALVLRYFCWPQTKCYGALSHGFVHYMMKREIFEKLAATWD